MTAYGEGTYGEGPYGIGSEYEELIDAALFEIMPSVLALDKSAILRRYIDSHDELLTTFDSDLTNVLESKQIANARGAEIDRIGRLFGQLGRRRGRKDSEYRNYLQSIVQSFDGRGTNPGIKFAIAGALNVEPENVTIQEDFIDLEDTIILDDWEEHSIQTVFDVFDLAKPSTVELNKVGKYEVYGGEMDMEIEVTAGNKSAGLGSGTIGDNEIGFYE